MAESIFTRMSRLLSATVEDSVDRLEKAGGEAVMREAIREADRAVDQVKTELESVMSRRLQAVRQRQMLAKRIDDLNGKATFAIGQGREELAEAALSRQIDFEAEVEKLGEVEAQARDEEARLADGLAALTSRKTQMEETLSAYVMARRETVLDGEGSRRHGHPAERQVDAAEQAFNRAMTSAGGIGLTRSEAGTVNRVAEIDALQKRAAVADRLAALKAQKAA